MRGGKADEVMTRYQLAKLVEWAGRLDSRKRMQKVVYLLQSGGCQLGANYFLHHYGPYSQDVANLCDEMVAAGLLEEQMSGTAFGNVRYSYVLPGHATQLIAQHERNPSAAGEVEELGRFEPLARRLAREDLWVLELASTVAYHHDRGEAWEQATASAAQFKKVDALDAALRRAVQLAQSVSQQDQ